MLLKTACFKQKFQPILCFITFLLSDLKLRNEILCTLSILCFVNIRTDRCARTQKLIYQHTFYTSCFHFSTKKYYALGKILCLISHNTG